MDTNPGPLAAIAWMPAHPVITVVGCHAGGEIGNVIVGGVDAPPGATVFEQMQAMAADDSVRRLLLHEPRGSVAVHSNLIVPSTRPDCALGYIIMEPTEYPAMSGSNTICVVTVLLETGMVVMREPVTTLRLEAPGGPIDVVAGCRAGKVEWVEFENVPCFADRIDAPLEVEGLGTLTVDVAFGGMWYAIADAHALGFALEPSEARDLSRVGEVIRVAAREQLPCVHPTNPAIQGVSIVEIAEPWRGVGAVSKNAVV
ncbi:MAG: trans-L-3-hydroxyproline dehydratase, partial [Chloroflexota bacterium]|nr:trans-L-3-hydroxyproline dehydratase [Chloroflexota bacterium]